MHLGNHHYNNGRLETAEKYYLNAYNKDRENYNCLMKLITIYIDLKKNEQVTKYCEEGEKLGYIGCIYRFGDTTRLTITD